MEIRIDISPAVTGRNILLFGVIILLCSCLRQEIVNSSGICLSEHTLLAITPDFSIKMTGDTLTKNYLELRSGHIFPMTGILRVDGKAYRFMGGDSLRAISLAPLADDSLGWQGKFSYLFPGEGWEQKEYDDSLWNEGKGALGMIKGNYPIYTLWGVADIYVRRHIDIENKDVLKDRKVYLRYACDDQMTFFCNGTYLFTENHNTQQPKCYQFADEDIARIVAGDNVLAAHGHNTDGVALLDFGLYIETKTYADAELAALKKVDIQATQTHYTFQCGDVELHLDFVSPSLSKKWDMTGWPVGFLSYEVRSKDDKEHAVEILFDVDTEWMFGKRKVEDWAEQDWQFIKSDSLYLAMPSEGTVFSCDEGHAILSQKLCAGNDQKGVLLLGYEEVAALQYAGECLKPLWKKAGTGEIKELMKSVGRRYQELKRECDKLDKYWNNKAYQTGGQVLVEQMLPAYRDFISSHRFVLSSNNKIFCFGDTLGNVRETYKILPVLSFFDRIDRMKNLLDPIFEYCEDIHWNKKYPPYDMGLYPVAAQQVKLENCGVEAAANMLLMTAAIVETERNFKYASLHWEQLCLWAEYLQERMEKEIFPITELLDENDERVKCALGLKAYHKLIQLKRNL